MVNELCLLSLFWSLTIKNFSRLHPSRLDIAVLSGETQKQLFQTKSSWNTGSLQQPVTPPPHSYATNTSQQIPTERVPTQAVSLEELEAQFAKGSMGAAVPAAESAKQSIVPGMPFGSPNTNPNAAMFQQGSPNPNGVSPYAHQLQKPNFTVCTHSYYDLPLPLHKNPSI